jgi:hypothetical protein
MEQQNYQGAMGGISLIAKQSIAKTINLVFGANAS